jgi:protein-arginine kinase activator protein McsA
MGERYADKETTTPGERHQAADLREQLRLAVETENFELAAELRDRLRVLE